MRSAPGPRDERRIPGDDALDRVFAGAVGARVLELHLTRLDDLEPEVRDAISNGEASELPPRVVKRLEPREETLLTVTTPEDLAELRTALMVGRSGFHCMCNGGPVVEVSGPDGVRARITLHHGRSIRWSDAWTSDAELVDGGRLVKWLAEHGVRGPLEEVEAALEDARQRRLASERWRRAVPRCLVPLWGELSGEDDANAGMVMFGGDGAVDWTPRVKDALEVLRKAHPVEAEAIRAVLAWLGEGAGPWSGFPVYESIARELLASFSGAAIAAAVSSGAPTRAQLVGAARTLVRRAGEAGFTLGPELRDELRAAIQDSSDNLAEFDSVYADHPVGRAKELREESARAAEGWRRGEALGRALASETDDFETRGTGSFGERGRRRVSVFAEEDGRFWLIFFEDGANKGDRRIATIPAAVAAARDWLEV